MTQELLKSIESKYMKDKAPEFEVGDTVKVKVLIREGKKERIQAFEGTVIAKTNSGINASFVVRKIVQGIGVERTFMLNAPKVDSVEVLRRGKTRRAKLYYLRKRVGTKATRLKEDTVRVAKEAIKSSAAKAEAKAAAKSSKAAAKVEAEKAEATAAE